MFGKVLQCKIRRVLVQDNRLLFEGNGYIVKMQTRYSPEHIHRGEKHDKGHDSGKAHEADY